MGRPLGVLSANDLTVDVMPCIRSSDYYLERYGYVCRRPKGRQDWQFILTLSGCGIVESGSDVCRCLAGELIVIPPGIPHSYYTEQNEGVWEKLWVHFVPRVAWKIWLEFAFGVDGVKQLRIGEPERATVEGAFRRLLGYCTRKSNVFKQELALTAVEEIILTMANAQSENRKRKMDVRVEEVLGYLDEHYAEPIQIEELARKVYLSPSRLTHLFKHNVGESILETLTKIRIHRAAMLLRSTSRPIVDIAFSVGFHSTNFFSRKFAECYDMNPLAYRKKQLNL